MLTVNMSIQVYIFKKSGGHRVWVGVPHSTPKNNFYFKKIFKKLSFFLRTTNRGTNVEFRTKM